MSRSHAESSSFIHEERLTGKFAIQWWLRTTGDSILHMDRLWKSLRSGLTRRSACSVLTLLAYAIASTGFPMGGHKEGQNTGCSQGCRCRCSQDARNSAECCCCRTVSVIPESDGPDRTVIVGRSWFKQNAARSHIMKQFAVNACCLSKSDESRPANNRSCCKSDGRQDRTPASRQVMDSDGDCQPHAGRFSIPVIVNGCNCGNNAAVGLCCNTDPRLPGDRVNVLPGVDWQSKCEFTCEILSYHTTTPETPPPEVSLA